MVIANVNHNDALPGALRMVLRPRVSAGHQHQVLGVCQRCTENPVPVLPRTKADKISSACYPSSPHSFKNSTVCRSEGMLWQICMPSGFLELSPSCTIPCLPPRLHSSWQGLWLCTVPKTSNDSLSTCLSPHGNRKPSLESCDCQISPRPFCSQAIQKLFSRGMLAFKGHTS